MQGREDKYFINMCRWIYGLACHSSPVVFSSAHDRSVSYPLKTTPSLFLDCVKPLITGALFLLKPILSCSVTPKKLTQPERKSKCFVSSIGIHRRWLEKWRIVSLKYQNFKERRLQHPGSCSVSPQPCLFLPGKGESWSSAGRGQAAGALPGPAPVTYLSFSDQKKDISKKKKKAVLQFPFLLFTDHPLLMSNYFTTLF